MRDRPEGPALLALARAILLDERLPLSPQECRPDARLVARAMAIAERESAAGETPLAALARELADFYEAAPGDADALWRRFAQDLRAGAFEDDARRERAARAVLWRLTLAKLRTANPQFLAENGLA
jgi:uncharacterized protein DUF6285